MPTQPETTVPDGLDVAIDRDAEVPIGVQLAWTLRARILQGELTPGQRLPGLREAAEATGVNINTVRAVYQRLDREGLIDSQQGSGTFVADTARRPSAAGEIAANAAREARETGVDPREVAATLYVAPGGSTGQASGDEDERAEAGRRRLLRGQIASLERMLGEIEGQHPGVAPPSTQTRRGIGPALLTAQELEQVRTSLLRRLMTVQAAIDEYLGESEPHAEAVRKRRPTQQTAGSAKRTPRPRTTPRPATAGT
jgi:DNA-binding transcriptional regulator YhcF (GntR family)